ncbi:TonB-dependent receptor (plasmid) [Sphingobium sp. SJ10-10]|uniref:TonB-dependent receptor n=1 Tax=Sphingobium sp. SJ10-10 TaxID=3114999 RepID=UPI002E17DD66|nr:TonB-dependent receptor [Sphingobium sp. SJ10-10]
MLSSAMAQTNVLPDPVQNQLQDIIVTARKRSETSLQVPVTIAAIGGQDLQNRGINSIDAVARLVPSMITGEGGGTVQGGIIAIRGISGADNNPLNDQAVSFNIDGVSVGRASVRRMSDMDIEQVEVLKGPQALYFGKNSPGGIISVRTADPTPNMEAKISQAYEINAREWRTEAYASGPISDSLGFRIAGIYSDMQGWAKSYVPTNFVNTATTGVFPPSHDRAPHKQDWALRGTLKFDDGGPFTARLKLAYARVSGTGSSANTQFVSCPLGYPQGSPPLSTGLPRDDCRADNLVGHGDFSPNLAALDPDEYPADGHGNLKQSQWLASAEFTYRPSDHLTLTSVTGLYKMNLSNLGNFTQNYYDSPTLPAQLLISRNRLNLREISTELRLASDFEGPVNFMLGGLYQDTRGRNGSTTARYSIAPIFVNKYIYAQEGNAYSVFGQVTVDFTRQLQLSGGARASFENKSLPGLLTATAAAPRTLVPITASGLTRDISFNNLSPEVTLSYRPTQDFNFYVSRKEGFLSGGFSALAPTAGVIAGTQQVNYDQQITTGFEGGIKASLFHRSLRVNLAVYDYKTAGLQVGVTTQGVQQELRNAGSVRTRGVDFDFTYRPPVEGLTLNGAVNYNDGFYIDYQASCYRGQSSATCFNQVSRVTHKVALLQDLSGQPLVRAPRWTGNAGFTYERTVGNGYHLGLSGNISHSDSYYTDTTNTPGGVQKGYELVDASLRFGQEQQGWEVALIGRNLTNEYFFVRSSDTPFTGTSPGASLNGVLGDTAASVGRGRELMIRLSYKFGGK